MGFHGSSEVKASTCNVGDLGSIPGLGRFPWIRKWQPTPVFLTGESHGRRSLVGYSLRGRKESDTTERLHFHFHFSQVFSLYQASGIYWVVFQKAYKLLLQMAMPWSTGLACDYTPGTCPDLHTTSFTITSDVIASATLWHCNQDLLHRPCLLYVHSEMAVCPVVQFMIRAAFPGIQHAASRTQSLTRYYASLLMVGDAITYFYGEGYVLECPRPQDPQRLCWCGWLLSLQRVYLLLFRAPNASIMLTIYYSPGLICRIS